VAKTAAAAGGLITLTTPTAAVFGGDPRRDGCRHDRNLTC